MLRIISEWFRRRALQNEPKRNPHADKWLRFKATDFGSPVEGRYVGMMAEHAESNGRRSLR